MLDDKAVVDRKEDHRYDAIISRMNDRDAKLHKVSFKLPGDAYLIEKYVMEHRLCKSNPEKYAAAAGSFNEYLANTKYPGKIVVAEISGNTGEYNGVNLVGGDFSGCTFKNIEIETDLKGCRFNDCKFENATFVNVDLTDVDFRGAQLKNIHFFDYHNPQRLEGAKLAFNDVKFVQRQGVFHMEDKQAIAMEEMPLIAAVEKKYKAKIDALEVKKNTLKAGTFLSPLVGISEEAKKGIARIDTQIAKLKAEQEVEVKAVQEKLRKEHVIEFKGQNDPTYNSMLSIEDSKYKDMKITTKIPTQEDFEKFMKQPEVMSFAQYLGAKEGERYVVDMRKITIAGKDMGGRDFSNANFSKVDASNVNFAGCKLDGACFEGAKLDGASFAGCNISGINLIGATAEKEVNIENAIFTNANFQTSNLKVKAGNSYIIGSDMTGAQVGGSLGEAQGLTIDKTDCESVNLSYLNGAYMKIRNSVMNKAIIAHCEITNLELEKTVAENMQILHTKTTELVIQDVAAQRLKIEDLVVNAMLVKGSDLSDAEIDGLVAANLSFEKSKADALAIVNSELDKLQLREVEAHGMKLKDSVCKSLEANELKADDMVVEDIKFEQVKMEHCVIARFQAARSSMEGVILKDVEAIGADFSAANLRNAVMERVNLEKAKLIATNLEESKLSDVSLEGAACIGTVLNGADVKDIKIDDNTNLAFAELENLKGSPEDIKKLREKKEKDMAQLEKNGWFNKSHFGAAATTVDASDRYKTQLLGAAVLTAAAGVAGFQFAGPLAGLQAGAVTGLLSVGALELMIMKQQSDARAALANPKLTNAERKAIEAEIAKNHYLNNEMGDILAVIGVVAQSMGVNAADKAVDGAAVGLVAASFGKLPEIGLMAGGAAVAYAGAKIASSDIGQKHSAVKKAGIGAAVVGGGGAVVGLLSAMASSSHVAHGAGLGALYGATNGAATAIKELSNYSQTIDDAGHMVQTGLKPEQLYRMNNKQLWAVLDKIYPTKEKLIAGIILGATTCLAGGFVVHFAIAAAIAAAAATSITIMVLPPLFVAGFALGYLYGDKIPVLSDLAKAVDSVFSSKESAVQKVEKQQAVESSGIAKTVDSSVPSREESAVQKVENQKAVESSGIARTVESSVPSREESAVQRVEKGRGEPSARGASPAA